MAKIIFALCAQALLIQAAFSQVSANSVVASGSGISGGFGFSGGSGFGNSVVSASGASGFGSGVSGLTGKAASASGLSASAATIHKQTGLNIVSGGPLLVTSISPIGPSGLAVASENGIEGVLTVTGELPFLSAVAFEGGLPTAGSGVAKCGCGNSEVGIVSEGLPGSLAASNPGRVDRRF